MKRKLNCILLIDDDEPTNFLHKMVIEEVDCAEQVVVVQSGEEALDYLKTEVDGKYPQPDLIFLDINMPTMNGWEFLEAYNQMDQKHQGHLVIVMLTTSLNPADKEEAERQNIIDDFINKPLTAEILIETLNKNFEGWR